MNLGFIEKFQLGINPQKKALKKKSFQSQSNYGFKIISFSD